MPLEVVFVHYVVIMREMSQIPFWEQYTLSIEEAAQYFRIGKHKLR